MTGQLKLNLLGAPEIRRDGQLISGFAHRKSLALLCYLAVSGRPHSRATLAGLLWGEATETNARAGLRKSLSELRKLAGSNLLITRHEVAFKQDTGYWLDVELFDQEAQRFDKSQGLSPAEAAALTNAAALYRGDFLAGFHVLRAQAFEEWILFERERLRLAALRMLYALAIHALTQAQYAEAISYAERVLALEPCHEEAHRLLMSLLALNGRQTAALRQYQICRSVLAEELGLEPNEETTALYERILAGDAKQANNEPPRQQLQRPSSPLIGRRQELNDILTHIHDPRSRLLTLLGPGGSGKSHLAREIASSYPDYAETGADQPLKAYLVSLASSPSIESLISALAQGVGFYFSQESHPRRQLLSYLRRQQGLLILDGCEGLLDLYEPDQGSFLDLVDDILGVAPGITILATSRVRLNLPSEFIIPLAGMAYPQVMPDNPNDLYAYDAVQLFLWRLRRVQPNLEPGADDLVAIARICRLAAGLPLEILLMANWARLLDPAGIAAQLSGAVAQRASGSDRRSPGRSSDGNDLPSLKRHLQRSLAPIFDHSWDLLTAVEQHTLATLSIFSGGFTYQAAQEITEISMRGLMALQDQSLLNRINSSVPADSANARPSRYVIHDLLSDFIAAKPDMIRSLDNARRQHSAYYMAELFMWAGALHDGREQETLIRMEVEIANARAAWDWAVTRGRFDLLDLGMDGLCRFYQLRYRHHEGESACRSAVKALSPSSADQRRILAKVQIWQSWFAPDHEQALELLLDSLERLDKLAAAGEDVRAERALASLMKGCRLLYTDHALSRTILQESLALYQELGDEWHAAYVLSYLHIQSWKSGEYEEGRRIARQCLALYQKTGYLSGYAGVLGDQGIGALQAGLVDEGTEAIEESIAIFEKLGNRAGIVKGLYFHGMALGFSGQWIEADRQLQKCVSIGEDQCSFFDTVLIALAIVKTHRGQYAEARKYARSGLDHATELDNQMTIGRGFSALALVALAQGDPQEAAQLAQEAVDVYTSFGQKTELGLALAAQGYAAGQNGDPARAQTYFNEALSLAAAHKDQLSLLYAFVGTAYLLSYLGQVEQAVENYAKAAQQPLVANSQWFHDVVKKRIDEASAALLPETVAEAINRGQAQMIR